MSRYYLFAICLCWPLWLSAVEGRGEFTTIINVPPQEAPQSIDSNTQLNLFSTGELPPYFVAGNPFGTATSVEVNIHGGLVGELFTSHVGSRVVISGGAFADRFSAYGGEVVVRGGEFRVNGTPLDGLSDIGSVRQIDLYRFGGDNVLSGVLADGSPFAFFDAVFEDILNPRVLVLERTELPPIKTTTISVPGDPLGLGIRDSQTLVVYDGASIPDSFNAGRGSKVFINGGVVGDDFELVGAEATINGGSIGYFFDAFDGSRVIIHDGSIQGGIDVARRSTFVVNGGSVGGGVDLYAGSFFELNGGAVGSGIQARSGSHVVISGGTLGELFFANRGSTVTVNGGSIGRYFQAYGSANVTVNGGAFDGSFRVEGSTVTINGGSLGSDLTVRLAGTVNVHGGEIGDGMIIEDEGTLHLFGSRFRIDGTPIIDLPFNEAYVIDDRNVTLSGFFEDGTPFSFGLSTQDAGSIGVHLYPTARVVVTRVPAAVPEPRILAILSALLSIATCSLIRDRRPFVRNRAYLSARVRSKQR